MIASVTSQSVVVVMGAGVGAVCLSFVIYWKLLGERYRRQQRQTVSEWAGKRRQAPEKPLISGIVLEKQN